MPKKKKRGIKQPDAVQLPIPEYNGSSGELSSTRYKPKSGEIPNGKAAWNGI